MLNGILLNDMLVLLSDTESDNLLRLLAVSLFHKNKMGKIDQKVGNILFQKGLKYLSRLTMEMNRFFVDFLKRIGVLFIAEKNKMSRHGIFF